MLKLTYLVQLGLVGAVAVPAVTQRGGDVTLETALAETERALSSLVRAPGDGGYAVVERALAGTEPPALAARERDELLARLAAEVAALQEELDEREATAGPPPTPRPGDAAPRAGLDDAQRARLAGTTPPRAARPAPEPEDPAARRAPLG